MSLNNCFVVEQHERGWKSKRSRAKSKKLKKQFWSKLRRRSIEEPGFYGYEF